MIKTKSLVIGGSIVIGIAFLMVIYFGLMSLGVVNHKVNTLVIRTDDVSQQYNGEVIKGSSFKLLEGKLNDSHTINVEFTGHQVNIGESLNYANITVLDDNENDVTDQYVIDKQYGLLKVLPRKITIKSEDDNKTFDGKYLNNKSVIITDGTLLDKHYLRVTESANLALPGKVDNVVEVKIYDQFDDEVTEQYEINYNYGKLSVEQIKVLFKSSSISKVYDGTPLNNKVLTEDGKVVEAPVEIEGKFIEDHTVVYTFNNIGITEVGTVENDFSVRIIDKAGKDVSHLYEITKEFGILTVIQSIYADGSLPKSPVISDISKNLLTFETNGFNNIYLRDFSFGDFSKNLWAKTDPYESNSNFNVFNNTALLASTLGRKRSVTIDYKRAQIPFLTPNYHLFNRGTNDIHNYGNKTSDVGRFEIDYFDFDFLNYFSKFPGLENFNNTTKEQDEYSSHVRNNYLAVDSTYSNELLYLGSKEGLSQQMSKFELIIKIKKVIENVAEYNDSFKKFNINNDADILLHFLNEAKEGNSKHFATAATLMYRSYGIPARYVSGIYVNPSAKKGNANISEADAHNWVEVYVDGIGWVIVEVTPGFDKTDIVLQAQHELNENGTEKYLEYTGKVYEFPSVDLIKVIEGELLDGHRIYSAAFSEEMKNARTYEKIYLKDVVIYDEDNNDVTSMYNIMYKAQKYTINRKNISVKTESGKREFNNEDFSLGENQTFDVIGLVENEFVDQSSIEFPSSRRFYGKTRNEVSFNIRDVNNQLTNNNYRVDISLFGWIEITQVEILFKAKDAMKVYDGTPLTSNEVELLSGNTFGFDFIAETTGSQTEIGSSQNIINKVTLLDGKIDMSENFNVLKRSGTLRVRPR